MTYWLNVHRYENIHLLEQSIGEQAVAEFAPSSGLVKVIIVSFLLNQKSTDQKLVNRSKAKPKHQKYEQELGQQIER